jgi:hypothetical protein
VRTHVSRPDVDRRVTFDRAVWTKPLAFAADAARQLCVLNRGGPLSSGRAEPERCVIKTVRPFEVCATAMRAMADPAVGGHLRRTRVRARR